MDNYREWTFPAKAAKDAVIVIEDDRANILADPLRQHILEILGIGKSIAEISQALDVTDARVLYHLRQLAQTGVVLMETDKIRPREWRCLPAAGKIRVRQVAENPIAIPTRVVSQFNQAFREAAEGLYGSTFQLSINHNRARLSEEQATEFGNRLSALINEYFPPGKGDPTGIKYGFYGILTPIDLHPLEDFESEA